MIDQSEWSRIVRFLAGESSPAESTEILNLIDSDAAFARQVDEVRAIWNATAGQPLAWDTDSAWMRLSLRARSETRRPSVALHSSEGSRVRHFQPAAARAGMTRVPWGRIAAAAAVIIAISGVAAGWPEAMRRLEVSSASQSPGRTYSTIAGQRASIQLIDGTKVELGPSSSLHIKQFASDERGSRIVELTGEAVFDVIHNEARPFLVYSRNAVTEDLGTTFGVRAYPADAQVRVVVAEGSVALRSSAAPPGSGTVLRTGDLAHLDDAGRVAVTAGVNTGTYLGWSSGRIAFNDEPLGNVVIDMGRMFDANIRISDSALARKRVTVDMPNGTLANVLDVLSTLLQIHQSRDGQAYVLGPSISH